MYIIQAMLIYIVRYNRYIVDDMFSNHYVYKCLYDILWGI